jgi:cytochrome c
MSVKSAALLLLLGMLAYRAAWTQPAAEGPLLFKKRCGACHAADRDMEGPRLGGVYGRVAGAVKSFHYSAELARSGVSWDGQTLNTWLSDPEKMVPGTEMAFRVEAAAERQAIIDYLKQLRAK